MTSHYTWGFVTTTYDFGGVLGRPLSNIVWALTICWSWLLVRVWSGPYCGQFQLHIELGMCGIGLGVVSARLKLALRCVGVIWFVFHVLQLLLIRCTQQNSYCISKYMMNVIAKLEPLTSELRLSDVHVCWFLSWMHRSSQLCSLLSVEYLSKFEDVVQSL